MKAIAIVLLSILSAVVYGIIHDEITARIWQAILSGSSVAWF